MADNAARSVTVLGLGPMGRAMVRAFRAAGTAVTVWNRTPAKADDLVALGATRAATVAEALAANEVVVLSLTDYPAMYDVLGQAPEALRGRVVVNLSSDSPENARRGAAWVRERGAEFLSGGFMSAGDDITHPDSYIFFGGPRAVFERHRELLRPLSPGEYLGADDGVAQVFYQALLVTFHPWLLAFDQALALIERSGHDIDRFLPYAQRSAGAYPFFMAESVAAAKAGAAYEESMYRMMIAGARHIVDASEDAGVDADLSHAAMRWWKRGLAASTTVGRPVSILELMRGQALSRPEPSRGNGVVEKSTSTATSK